ncbi:tyrosine-type recombinase/integrase [Mycobacterium sp.]|uniref:tyrosine-type recombinase/integrase n=1 Tax=Mycobacterium sp. TaxID=1785 RepID=UPI003F9CA88A
MQAKPQDQSGNGNSHFYPKNETLPLQTGHNPCKWGWRERGQNQRKRETKMTTRKQDKQAPYHRPTNEQARSREWLEIQEIERLMTAAAKLGRHGHRDRTMILMAFRHGLRVAELVDLQWTDVNFAERKIFIRRLKGSNDSMHHLERDEIAALRRLGGDQSGFIFLAEGGGPMCSSGFFKVIRRAGLEAGLPLKLHPHMLRHSCGYALANKNVNLRFIQDWLGHRSIANTVKYTALSPLRYAKAGLWK